MLPVALITVTVGLTRDFIRFLKDNEERKLKIREKSVAKRNMKVEPLESGINEDCEKVPYPFGHEIRWPWYRKIQVQNISFFNCLNPAGKMTKRWSFSFFLKMGDRSEAKSTRKSFASEYFEFYFWREASLRAFSFASLSHFSRNASWH